MTGTWTKGRQEGNSAGGAGGLASPSASEHKLARGAGHIEAEVREEECQCREDPEEGSGCAHCSVGLLGFRFPSY